MTIYNTDKLEIIELHNLYMEIKNFITYFKNTKQLFTTHYNIVQKNNQTYIVFPGDNSSYNNFRKVYKLFISGIDLTRYQKYLNCYQIFKRNYCYNELNNEIYSKGNTDCKYNFNSIEELQKSSESYKLFNCCHIIELKTMLKAIIKHKLNNLEIPLYPY